MKHLWISIGVLVLLGVTWIPSGAQTLAFPTAQGYGRFSTGGRGGKACNINSLSGGMGSGGSCNAGGCGGSPPFAAGTVTFLDCWTDRFGVGARTFIFRVGGIIDIPFQYYSLKPNLRIAGESAPGGGITIKNTLLTMCALSTCQTAMSHAIVRHIRVRPGANEGAQGATGEYNAHDIIWDHNSFSWAIGDTTGAIVGSYNVTYQWNLYTEGIAWSPQLAEPSKAFLNQTCGGSYNPDGSTGFSLHHNFIAHYWERVPYIQCGNVQWVNNVIYDSVNGSLVDPPTHGTAIQANWVNNYYMTGPNTDLRSDGTGMATSLGCCPGTGACQASTSCPFVNASGIYVSGNYHSVLRPNNTMAETAFLLISGGTSVPVKSTPYAFPAITTVSAQQARTDVVNFAGAYAVAGGTATVRRDSVDLRAVSNITNRTSFPCGGAIPNSCMITNESQVGGYPPVANGVPYTDTDGDGMEDAWESAHGLNPNDPSDGPLLSILDRGYTNLEVFLNELAGDYGQRLRLVEHRGVPTHLHLLGQR
jgi:hypothetical protein